MSDSEAALEELLESLLYEGYALYPYTPGAAKNATPTPFGIVYPPAYAARTPGAFDHLEMQGVLVGPIGVEGGSVEAGVRFLQSRGPRHQAVERRLTLPPVSVGELARAAREMELELQEEDSPAGEDGCAARGTRAGGDAARDRLADGDAAREAGVPGEAGVALLARARLSASPLGPGLTRIALRVENATPLDDDQAGTLDRAGALRCSLLSTHVLLRAREGRFVSPLERQGTEGAAVAACRSVNTWPVLATPEDDALLGAAIVLPDHPRLAPESRLSLFDGTEIEEALLLHLHALSDSERQAIAGQDETVREMIERAMATTPEDILSLHGRLRVAVRGTGGPSDA